MLNCKSVTLLYSESQERTLTLQERMTLKLHVMMCSGCRNFGLQMQFLRQATSAYAQGADERNEKTEE